MKTPQKEIMLQNTRTGIMAHWMRNGEPDAEVVALLGTHILPTAYTAAMDMTTAAKKIRALNPGYTVSVV